MLHENLIGLCRARDAKSTNPAGLDNVPLPHDPLSSSPLPPLASPPLGIAELGPPLAFTITIVSTAAAANAAFVECSEECRGWLLAQRVIGIT